MRSIKLNEQWILLTSIICSLFILLQWIFEIFLSLMDKFYSNRVDEKYFLHIYPWWSRTLISLRKSPKRLNFFLCFHNVQLFSIKPTQSMWFLQMFNGFDITTTTTTMQFPFSFSWILFSQSIKNWLTPNKRFACIW